MELNQHEMLFFFFWFTHPKSRSITEGGLKAGTWKLDRKQRPWRNGAYWLIPHGLFSYITQDYLPRGGTAHCELGAPPSITLPENSPKTAKEEFVADVRGQEREPMGQELWDLT